MQHPTRSQSNLVWWVIAITTVLGVGLGDRLLTHWAYALERGRMQATDEELAELEEQLPELQSVSRAFKLVAKVARAGVVHIRVAGGEQADVSDDEIDEYLRDQLDGVPPEELEELREQARHWLRNMRPPPGSGSGIIIDRDGYILTNNHVVENRESITVILHDEREFKAEVIGTDSKSDLAVVRIDAADLHPLRFGDSDKLEVGDWVIAVGSPFGLQQTVTHGIVSAKGRSRILGIDIDYQDFIQTDAAVNPGNSGGPLLNLRGEVMGVNTAIATHSEGYNAGIAFTIPSNMAVKVANQLKTRGTVQRGWLGISFTAVQKEDIELFGLDEAKGVLVELVLRRSPADRAGIQVEDVVVAIGGEPIDDSEMFRARIADVPPNERVELKVIRDGEPRTISVRLGLQPDDLRTAALRGGMEARELPRLGLQLRTMRSIEMRPTPLRVYDKDVRGVAVMGIVDSKERPDVQAWEVIVACNGKPVENVTELKQALEEIPRKRDVRLTVLEPTGDRRIITIDGAGGR